MSIEVIDSMLSASPFEPFRVCISDGKELDVRHPDYLLRTPGKQHIMVFTSPERFQLIDLRHVTRLEPLGAATHP
jgi:hypothetical protein